METVLQEVDLLTTKVETGLKTEVETGLREVDVLTRLKLRQDCDGWTGLVDVLIQRLLHGT